MSMIGCFLSLNAFELEELIADPSGVADFVFPDEEENEASIDVDKAWHGIHFLLTGDAWGGSPPLADVVLGGTEIGEDIGYGPARYLTPAETKAAADAIAAISPDDFRARYDAAALSKHEIYPGIWDDPEDEALEYLAEHFESIREYFEEAATRGDAMLKYIS